MREELIDYIKKSFAVGKAESDIREDLISAGWQTGDIQKAIDFCLQRETKNISYSNEQDLVGNFLSNNNDNSREINNNVEIKKKTSINVLLIVILAISLLLVGGFVLFSLGRDGEFQNTDNRLPLEEEGEEEVALTSSNFYSSDDGNFKLNLPLGWSVFEDSVEEGAIMFNSPEKFTHDTDYFYEAFIVVAGGEGEEMSLEQAIDEVKGGLSMGGSRVVDEKRAMTSSGSETFFVYAIDDGEEEDWVVMSVYTMVQRNGFFYMIGGSAREDNWSRHKDVIEKSLLSFTINDISSDNF